MKNETERRTAKGNVIRNNLTGKEATIEHREDQAIIISKQSETKIPEIKIENSAAMHIAAKTKQEPETKVIPETKSEAKAKAEKKPKAKAKAKPKAKLKKKEPSPLRKITLSRTTMQLTVPSEARDAMLKFLDIKLENLKAKRSLTTWDDKQGALMTRIVEVEPR